MRASRSSMPAPDSCAAYRQVLVVSSSLPTAVSEGCRCEKLLARWQCIEGDARGFKIPKPNWASGLSCRARPRRECKFLADRVCFLCYLCRSTRRSWPLTVRYTLLIAHSGPEFDVQCRIPLRQVPALGKPCVKSLDR